MEIKITNIPVNLNDRFMAYCLTIYDWLMTFFGVSFSFFVMIFYFIFSLLLFIPKKIINVFLKKSVHDYQYRKETAIKEPEWEEFIEIGSCKLERKYATTAYFDQPFYHFRSTPYAIGLDDNVFSNSFLIYKEGLFLIRINKLDSSKTNYTLVYFDTFDKIVKDLSHLYRHILSYKIVGENKILFTLDGKRLKETIIVEFTG